MERPQSSMGIERPVTNPRVRQRSGANGRIRMYAHRQWRKWLDRPLEASLDISGRCDLSCVSCNMWSEPHSSEQNTKFWSNLMGDLTGMGVRRVVLIGAEPLMRNDIGQIIQASRGHKLRVTVFTNGYRLVKYAQELVHSGVDRLVLSLDGPEAAVHNGLRAMDGVFEMALEGWHLVGEEALKQKVTIPRGMFHTTVSIANVRMIPEMFALAKQEKVGLTLQAISQVPKEEIQKCRRGRNIIASRQYISNDGDLWLSEKAAVRLKQRLRQLGEGRKNISARVLMSLSNQHLTTGTFPIISCAHVHHTISVNPQGIVYPCAMLRNYHYGSLEDNSVVEIWKGKKRREFLKSLKKEFFPVCKYCCHYLNNLTPAQMTRVLFGVTLP